mgnify:CR=1 FL=1|jgi:hypothetical protein
MKAIHLLSKPQGLPIGMTAVAGVKDQYRSEAWPLANNPDLEALIGGWVYFHDTKADGSRIGGRIVRIELVDRVDKAISEGVAFVFDSKLEGRKQLWRGADHGMAWTGGIVDGTYLHEA